MRLPKIPCLFVRDRLQSRRAVINFLVGLSRKRLFAFALFFWPAGLLAVTLVEKNPVRPADADSAVAIWDIDLKQANALPRNFRTTDEPVHPSNGEASPAATGLTDLRESGSGEFTPEGLKLLLTRIRGPVTVFDLRQETHIFVNDLLSAGMRRATGRMSVKAKAQSKRVKIRG